MEKHWESIEKLVHLIEKSISPTSTVEHNVKLPDLTSANNNLRQCDIVIKSGTPQRQTITIVEVQDRNSQLNLNTFQGFVQKMHDVGAQHLICVSRKKFSETIVEKARKSGGTIRLVTLSKFEPNNFPIELPSLNVIHNVSQLVIREHPEVSFTTQSEIIIELSDIIFEIPQLGKTFDWISLANYYISYIIKPEKDGDFTIVLPSQLFDLNILDGENSYKVDMFKWKINFEVVTHEIQAYGYTYNQLDTGAIAWMLECCSEAAGRKRFVRMPLIPNGDGTFEAKFIIDQ
jgi:hypothetical protein